MLAIPVWILFEAGLFASRHFLKPRKEEEEEEDEDFDIDAELEAGEQQLEALDREPEVGP